MTAQEIEVDPVRSGRPVWGPVVSGVRWALIICWVLVLAGVVLVGERPSSLARLEADVAVGEAQAVRVVGGLRPGGTGSSVAEVHWRRGAFGYWTEVIEARPRRAALRRSSGDGVTAVITGDVGTRLAALDPDLHVVRAGTPRFTAEFLGWRLPGWLGGSALFLSFCTLGLLIGGPEPWRATRWAWFWLLTAPVPVAALAFLLLAGPTPLIPAPRRPANRLTGGWAFLMSVMIAAALRPDG